jgi:hypothetical protein
VDTISVAEKGPLTGRLNAVMKFRVVKKRVKLGEGGANIRLISEGLFRMELHS